MPSQSSTGLPVLFTISDFPGILFKTPMGPNTIQ